MAKSRTSFQPGQSGNPGGRPKEVAEVRELARECTEDAINTLTEIMSDKNAPPSARCRASEALLDRGWGKPTDTLRVDELRQPTVQELAPDWDDEPL